MSNILVVMALDIESRGHFDHCDVVYTGLGKVNAAYRLTRAIADKKPDMVVNLGSAGSNHFKTGSLVCCTQFVQRDMDVTPLGFKTYETGFDASPVILDNGQLVLGLDEAICGTGDNFDTSGKASVYNVVDMEAYALAKVCLNESLPFYCVKYISDGADDSAATDWEEALEEGAKLLSSVFEQQIVKKAA